MEVILRTSNNAARTLCANNTRTIFKKQIHSHLFCFLFTFLYKYIKYYFFLPLWSYDFCSLHRTTSSMYKYILNSIFILPSTFVTIFSIKKNLLHKNKKKSLNYSFIITKNVFYSAILLSLIFLHWTLYYVLCNHKQRCDFAFPSCMPQVITDGSKVLRDRLVTEVKWEGAGKWESGGENQ